jgi:hypothetical protein
MAFFPDLGPHTGIIDGPHIRAVGWLAAGHPFDTGEVPADLVDRIAQYADRWDHSVRALRWPVAKGPHTCELCHRERRSGNFGVPSGRRILYVCPEMIAHYVSAHSYRPPREFLDAIATAALPGTPEYAAAVAGLVPRGPTETPPHCSVTASPAAVAAGDAVAPACSGSRGRSGGSPA